MIFRPPLLADDFAQLFRAAIATDAALVKTLAMGIMRDVLRFCDGEHVSKGEGDWKHMLAELQRSLEKLEVNMQGVTVQDRDRFAILTLVRAAVGLAQVARKPESE